MNVELHCIFAGNYTTYIMQQQFNIEELNSNFAEFLKRKMYRNTQERYKVIERIALFHETFDKHFSADELYLFMSNRGDKVSRATVYSTLDLLTQCSILVKHRFQGDSAHYELSSRMPHHGHLVCIECNRVVEFTVRELDSIKDKVASSFGFEAIEHSLQIFGACKNVAACEHNPKNKVAATVAL